jgi:hypothetical protein
MDQYKHIDQDYENLKKANPDITQEQLFEKLTRLELQVQQLTKTIEFLERQDNRNRSSFEQIQSRIAARK